MKFLWSFLLVAMTVSMFAVGSEWGDNGLPIRQGGSIEWSRSGTVTTDGNIVYIWSDTRRGDRDVWAQKVNPQGQNLWTTDGVMVNGEINRQEDPVGIATTDGGVIIAWVDFRNEESGDIYAQKLDSNGNCLWDESGVPLCTATGVQINLNIIQDLDGGAYIVWEDQRVGGDVGIGIYGVHLNSSGTDTWDTANGTLVAGGAGDQSGDTFWEDGQGGGIMAYIDSNGYSKIRACRITADGTIPWNNVICEASGEKKQVKITPDTDDSFCLVWVDFRDDTNGDLYAQRIDRDGNAQWDEPIAIIVAPYKQENPRITSDGEGNSFIAWQDSRATNNLTLDICVQKINSAGALQWNADGVYLTDYVNDQLDPRIVTTDDGGCLVAWTDVHESGAPKCDIYMQRVHSDGSIVWAEDGVSVATDNNAQTDVLIKRNDAGIDYLAWSDNRDGSIAIYIQNLDASGNTLLQSNGQQMIWQLSGNAGRIATTAKVSVVKQGVNSVIVWRDTRYGESNTCNFIQIVHPDGSFQFAANGIPITTSNFQQSAASIAAMPNGNIALVCNYVNSLGTARVIAQIIDAEGNRLLGDGGLEISDQTDMQDHECIGLSGNDLLVSWTNADSVGDFTTLGRVYLQKVTSDGQLPWGTSGKLIASGTYDYYVQQVVGSYIVWEDIFDVYASHFDTDGNVTTGWPSTGLSVCSADYIQINPAGTLTSDGSLLFVWEDKRSEAGSDIYGQIVNADGTVRWITNGLPLAASANDQDHFQIAQSDDYNYMVWSDYRNGTKPQIYFQKFDNSGSLFLNDGEIVCANDSTQDYASFDFTHNDDANTPATFIAWQNGGDIAGQLLGLDGTHLWGDDPVVLCNAIRTQSNPQVVSFGQKTVLTVWIDARSSGKEEVYGIYAQRLHTGITSNDDSNQSTAAFQLRANYPNPFNPITNISFSLKQTGKVELAVYNLRGQKVATLVKDQLDAGTHNVTWNGTNAQGQSVASGMYFYRLSTNGQSQTRKMILMK